ncbi:MAG: prolyl oligopeptidase family serine peptidase [Candidatus Saccharibacteria bacterium]|nr:prolyl oligopeptidase family serine peptidase [Candidatus Saccharibacteria bacterium]
MYKKPPITQKIPTTEILHGRTLNDDYRWLEDITNPDAQKWIDQQNAYTDDMIAKQPDFNKWEQKVERFVRLEKHSMPVRKKDFKFYIHQAPEDDFPKLMVIDENDNEKVLLDLATIDKGKPADFSFWSASHDGSLVAYGIAKKGNEISTLRVRDVVTGKDLDDEIQNSYDSPNWLDDNSGFFYSKGPLPGTVPENDIRMNTRLYIHKLGDSVENDILIFGEGRPSDDMLFTNRRFGAPYLAISVTNTWSSNDVYLYDIKKGKTIPLFVGKDAEFEVASLKNGLIVKTNYKAPNNKIISIPFEKLNMPIHEQNELIPESDELISFFAPSKSRLFVGYFKDASTFVEIFDYDGEKTGKLPTPDICDINMRTNSLDDEVYFSVETMVETGTIYKLDAISLEATDYYRLKLPHSPKDYIIKREWTTSKDGTKLPIFIIHKKDLKINGKAPTILHGYGGFAYSESPSYLYSNMAWLENGGIFANAILRGGGEYGEKWHQDGILNKKQNTFDDFIACAQYLQEKKYTNNEHLAIIGGSNGGLLVGAVSVQRPDLFKAVVCLVPLLDMIHFHKLLIASRWVSEYGNPEKSNDFTQILKWSPYQNVSSSDIYPATFFRTALNDTRVHPMHALKMVAKLQNIEEPKIILLRVDKDTGHTGIKPRTQIIKTIAEQFTFLAWQLGL